MDDAACFMNICLKLNKNHCQVYDICTFLLIPFGEVNIGVYVSGL